MRKNAVLTNILLAVVLLGAVANLLVFFRYLQVLNTAQLLQLQAQRLQARATGVNRDFTVARSLAAEALQYGQTHPEIRPVLEPLTPLLQRMELVPQAANE